ncbi:MAG: carbamoyl-phosphate synthase small subunit, partial [Beggiatoa sp.]|nr:carbamoyl-phosphate synthase small subunit [Beggiatoa sp.]
MTHPALLALEDGSVFYGVSIGARGQSVGEVVFNTAITGYQEILTDPSYFQQIVTLTDPHIGNVGANADDEESPRVYAGGLVIRDVPKRQSHWRSEGPLGDYLERQGVVAIAGIDTWRLVRILREGGAQRGSVMAGEEVDAGEALCAARAFAGLEGADLAKEVTTPHPYAWPEGSLEIGASEGPSA